MGFRFHRAVHVLHNRHLGSGTNRSILIDARRRECRPRDSVGIRESGTTPELESEACQRRRVVSLRLRGITVRGMRQNFPLLPAGKMKQPFREPERKHLEKRQTFVSGRVLDSCFDIRVIATEERGCLAPKIAVFLQVLNDRSTQAVQRFFSQRVRTHVGSDEQQPSANQGIQLQLHHPVYGVDQALRMIFPWRCNRTAGHRY